MMQNAMIPSRDPYFIENLLCDPSGSADRKMTSSVVSPELSLGDGSPGETDDESDKIEK